MVQPIVDRFSIIESDSDVKLPTSQVEAPDLIPDIREYVLGPGDIVSVTVFELRVPNLDDTQTLRINETGQIRPAIIGPIRAAGRSERQLEDAIRDQLDAKGILRDATVSVITQQSRQNTYSVFGESSTGGLSSGTYIIPKPDFRLVEALLQARGVPSRTKRIFVIRTAALDPAINGDFEGFDNAGEENPDRPVPVDPGDLLGGDLEGGLNDAGPGDNQPDDRNAPPTGVESGLDTGSGSQWVYVDGNWVRTAIPAGQGADETTSEEDENLAQISAMVTQRIIEIPYEKLKDGDMRYNIVIRAGDIISVPGQTAGFVYVMGAINRPGAFTVPGERELTLMRLIASAGGLSTTAWPNRVDLIRQINDTEQAIVRIDVRAMFNGTEPDIYLKPNDMINVGTSGAAVPLAVFRNGLRATYGFGFVLDRNFNADVFGP